MIKQKKMLMQHRTPIVTEKKEDLHGYKDIAFQIKHAVNVFELPVTVGLSGDYGSGKSTMVALTLRNIGFTRSEIFKMIEKGELVSLPRNNKIKTKKSIGAIILDASLWEDTPNLFGVLLLSLVSALAVVH